MLLLCDADLAQDFPSRMAIKYLQDRMNLSFYKPSSTSEEYPCGIEEAERAGAAVSAKGTCEIPELAETQRFDYAGAVSTRGFDLRVTRTMEYGTPGSDAEIAEQRKAKIAPVTSFVVRGTWAKDC